MRGHIICFGWALRINISELFSKPHFIRSSKPWSCSNPNTAGALVDSKIDEALAVVKLMEF